MTMMKWRRWSAGLLLWCAGVATAVAAQADWNVAADARLSGRIDAIYGYYDAPHMPGAIVAVLQGGELVHLRGYGHANREYEAPWTPDTLYTFFSTTKSMTCLALLRLAEQGRIGLDDEIQHYLPDFPRFAHAITVRHLMNHTSGLWQDESLLHLAGTGASYQPLTLQELYELNRKQTELPYAPGSNWYYNDAGTRLAARIVERATGQDFDAAMKALVFGPAGMDTARIKSQEPVFYPGQASSYLLYETPGLDPARDPVRIGGVIVETSGDGGGMGTIRDFIAYARFITRPREDGSRWIDRLTEARPSNDWFTPAYRYGFVDETHRGVRVIYHGGFYGKRIAYLPELDAWVLQMRNGLDYDVRPDADRMADTIDAVLATVRDGYYLSSRNPDRDAVLGLPRDQGWRDDEIARLSGTFVEPESGYVVRVAASDATPVRQLRYRFHGAGGVLVRGAGSDVWVTHPARSGPNPIRLVREGSRLSLQYADWPAPRPMQRVERAFVPSAAEMEALSGWYLNDALGVHYRIVREGDGLRLHINGGNRASERFALHPVAPDVFEATLDSAATYLDLHLTLRVDRVAGAPLQLNLTGLDVKDLRLRKLSPDSLPRTSTMETSSR